MLKGWKKKMVKGINVKNLSYELEVDRITTNKYKSKVVKEKDWSDKTIVPMTTDIMFKTMYANTNRKKYLSRLLSYLLNLSEKEIFENFEYFNVELDKDYVKQKNLRADIVGKLYGVLINVEMNKKPTLDRNIEYIERISRSNIVIGNKADSYLKAIQINLNDVSYCNDEIVNYFSLKDRHNRAIGNKVLVNVSIPLIREKMYTKGTKSLRGIERFIGMATTSNIEKARIIARRDKLMKEYIEDAKRAENNVLPYYYDLEVDYSAYYREEGREEGWTACQKEERSKLLESIKKMCKTGLPIETILECFDLSEDETKKIKRDLVHL